MDTQSFEAGDSISKILHESNSDVFTTARQAIMEKVLLATVQEAIDALGSPDAIAQQALLYVDAQHPILNEAREALQIRLVQDVARSATESLEATEDMVEQARPQVDEQPLVAAVDALKARLVEEIAQQTTAALSDTEAMADEAADYLNDEHEALMQAVDALKEQILRTIVSDSLAQINSEVGGSGSKPAAKTTPPRAPGKAPAERIPAMASVPLPKAAPPAPSETPEATLRGPVRQQKMVANGYPMIEETIVEGDLLAETNALLDGMTNTGLYVYGIVASNAAAVFDPATLEGLDAAYPLNIISFDAITALVSEVPLDAFGVDAEDETWHERSKRIHNAICEQVDDADVAILPMPSRLTYASKEELETALVQHHDDLLATLRHVTGRQEWSVKIYCDVVKIWQAMLEDEKETHAFLGNIGEMVELLGENGIKLDSEAELEAFKAGMEVEVDDMIGSIFAYCKAKSHKVLHEIAADSTLTPPADDGQVFGGGTMVLGASYLVDTDESKHFLSILETMAAEHKKLGFSYYIGGPYFAYQHAAEKAPVL